MIIKQQHLTTINIQAEIATLIEQIGVELSELYLCGVVTIDISPTDLFYLEALGYLVDFSTGMVSKLTSVLEETVKTPVLDEMA